MTAQTQIEVSSDAVIADLTKQIGDQALQTAMWRIRANRAEGELAARDANTDTQAP